MRVLVLGGTGMLGHKLSQMAADPIDVWATVRGDAQSVAHYGFYCPDRVIGNVDALDEESVRRAIERVKPQAVVNCVGLIKQHPLANDPEVCISTNALLPHQLARVCAEYDARLLHISTDCVFAGTKGAYKESDATDAEDLYGRTKALGETIAPNAITLRTSIIGRELTGQFGLVEWFLSQTGSEVRGFSEAWFSGLTTQELTRVIGFVLTEFPDLTGLYQVSSEPIDKCSLITLIRDAYGVSTSIKPCVDVRLDRTLDSTRFRTATGYKPPDWTEMIREMASDLTPYDTWKQTS